jgi:hypothetical protein
MDSFDLYLAYISFSDNDFGKVRPTVILELEQVDNVAQIIPIYSKKESWKESVYEQLYKIKDSEEAGLNNAESYADLAELQNYPFKELVKFQKIGHLSNRDIAGLIDAFEKYYM